MATNMIFDQENQSRYCAELETVCNNNTVILFGLYMQSGSSSLVESNSVLLRSVLFEKHWAT
jgi:hypothetical protein